MGTNDGELGNSRVAWIPFVPLVFQMHERNPKRPFLLGHTMPLGRLNRSPSMLRMRSSCMHVAGGFEVESVCGPETSQVDKKGDLLILREAGRWGPACHSRRQAINQKNSSHHIVSWARKAFAWLLLRQTAGLGVGGMRKPESMLPP